MSPAPHGVSFRAEGNRLELSEKSMVPSGQSNIAASAGSGGPAKRAGFISRFLPARWAGGLAGWDLTEGCRTGVFPLPVRSRTVTLSYNRKRVRVRTVCMKSKSSSPHPSSNLPVSKQTAGGVAGAIVGGVIAGPVGAVAGAIAGTIMGNRAAKGKTLISSGTVKTASKAVKVVKDKLPTSRNGKSAVKAGPVSSPRPKQSASPKSARKAAPRATAKKKTVKSR